MTQGTVASNLTAAHTHSFMDTRCRTRRALTERQARLAGHDVAVGMQGFTGVAKAKAMGETRGSITFVADATTAAVLGCHIRGERPQWSPGRLPQVRAWTGVSSTWPRSSNP